MYPIILNVNGISYNLTVRADEILVDVLRNRLKLSATKKSCGTGDCGACTIIIDGLAVNSCLILAVEVNGKEIITLESLSTNGDLHPLQSAFLKHGALQCGFCTPGMIMSAKALLDKISNPTEDEIKEAIRGNLCRCTGYKKIVEAIKDASQKMRRRDKE